MRIIAPRETWNRDRDAPRHLRLAATFPDEEIYVEYRGLDWETVLTASDLRGDVVAALAQGLSFAAENPDSLQHLGDGDGTVGGALEKLASPEFKQLLSLIDAAFCAAVVDPPAFLDKEEARAAGGLWVGHIKLADRCALVNELGYVLDTSSYEA